MPARRELRARIPFGVDSGRQHSGPAQALLLDLAPARDVLLVLVVGLGKDMAARAVGDEVEVLGAGRIGDRFKSGPARIGDRPRRQALDRIGVVGRRRVDLAAQDAAAERAFAADEAVHDRRVGLQLHPLRAG